MTTGEEIIDAIINGGLCRVDSPNPGVIVWSSGAAEQIDALIQAGLRPRCIDCGRFCQPPPKPHLHPMCRACVAQYD